MGLEGRLSELSFTEMLQIIAFSKKTGCLRLESPHGRGVVVLEGGRIVFACSGSTIGRLKELLRRPSTIAPAVNRETLEAAVRELSGLSEGRFHFAVTEKSVAELGGVRIDPFLIPGGVEPQELLLDLAVAQDQERHEATTLLELALETEPDGTGAKNDDAEAALAPHGGTRESVPGDRDGGAVRDQASRDYVFDLSRRLLRSRGTTDVSRLVQRVAAHFLERGVLFIVVNGTARGLDGFGLEPDPASARSLARSILLDAERVRGISERVGGEGAACRLRGAELQELVTPVFDVIGRRSASEAVVVSMAYKGRMLLFLYGDNGSSGRRIGNLESLELFVAQSEMALENKLLQRELSDRDAALVPEL